jgi:K+-sensing histidine kinase KdpD
MRDAKKVINPASELSRIIETLTSNDIISTLSNIADLGENLEQGVQDYSPEETGTLIKLQSEKIARLIDSLMVAQQVQEGRLAIHAKPMTLRPALESAINVLNPLSEKYATKMRLGRKHKLRPVLVDENLITPILHSAFEGVIRTTVSRKVKVDTISHDDKLFLHITDKDASYESQADGASRTRAGSAHAIAIPSFYVASSLMAAMGGELRIKGNKDQRHIDLIFPHSFQLAMELQ